VLPAGRVVMAVMVVTVVMAATAVPAVPESRHRRLRRRSAALNLAPHCVRCTWRDG
jgi:hypothetical protein